MIVLANSRKPGGRCVAGISMDSGVWIRPVTARSSTGALSERDCRVGNRMARPLDVVRFAYSSRVGDPAQPENVTIEEQDWELLREISPAVAYPLLRPHLAPGPALLGGTEKGVDDRVAKAGMDASLTLVEPDSITFRAQDNPFKPVRQARAIFEIAGQRYDLSITDRVVAPVVKQLEDGDYTAGQLGFEGGHTVLTVSLAESFKGAFWKLAAAVLFLS